MKALDLYCKAGGATKGLQRAGFHVTGVDRQAQPRYVGDAFIQADVMALPVLLADFDFVWASPPCQKWTPMVQQRGHQDRHPDLIAPTRELLLGWGGLYAIENVPRAPLRHDVVLTGCMFGLSTYRRRIFETNLAILAVQPGRPFGPKTRPGAVTVAGSSGGKSNRDHWQNGAKAAWQAAMGIDWMLNREMAEAVPPVYAEFIGRAAIQHIQHARAA